MSARRRSHRVLRLLAPLCLALAACSPEPPSAELSLDPVRACNEVAWDGVPRPRNVILIVNDTMRRDRVGIYGGAARTPAFDAFAREGLPIPCRWLPLPLRDYFVNTFGGLSWRSRKLVLYDQLKPSYLRFYTREQV